MPAALGPAPRHSRSRRVWTSRHALVPVPAVLCSGEFMRFWLPAARPCLRYVVGTVSPAFGAGLVPIVPSSRAPGRSGPTIYVMFAHLVPHLRRAMQVAGHDPADRDRPCPGFGGLAALVRAPACGVAGGRWRSPESEKARQPAPRRRWPVRNCPRPPAPDPQRQTDPCLLTAALTRAGWWQLAALVRRGKPAASRRTPAAGRWRCTGNPCRLPPGVAASVAPLRAG